jgi:hypothetical protein
MNTMDTSGRSLNWEVFTSKRPGLSRDLPPGKEDLMWVANSSTLIYGGHPSALRMASSTRSSGGLKKAFTKPCVLRMIDTRARYRRDPRKRELQTAP